jgi:beta-lactam-binding protein with PASTA domain
VKRDGKWLRDNGYCRGSRLLVYFSGRSPAKEADCKPNEVSVPLVVGMTAEGAVARLADQPLEANIVYRPAKPGKSPGLVVDQHPRAGGLSAHDSVLVVVSKARYGLLPNFVGSSLEDVQREVARQKLRAHVVTAPGHVGTVLRQTPKPGVAIAPGLLVTIQVGDGSRRRTP